MKLWIEAVCDKHQERCYMANNNPTLTSCYLSEFDKDIEAWLWLHYACDLRIIRRDDELDKICHYLKAFSLI